MRKSQVARAVGFVGALGASAALVGAAASSTGAYFTDSQEGNLQGSTGHLQITENHPGEANLTFADLVPGEYQTKTIGYTTDSSTPEDIWLYFPDGRKYAKFTGQKNHPDYADGGLGRYGHFAVVNNAGNTLFSSYNLANEPGGTSGCANADGHGSGPQATSEADTPPYCGVPRYMLVESNVPSGANRNVKLTFGVTGRWQSQNAPAANVPFEIVATQHGVRPDAGNY